jgi:hypothetical protein
MSRPARGVAGRGVRVYMAIDDFGANLASKLSKIVDSPMQPSPPSGLSCMVGTCFIRT